jgi:hypothetical protein
MDGLYKCSTCHWISRDGRCFNNRASHGLNHDQMSANDSCPGYMMPYALKQELEAQPERERKEQEHQKWLVSEEGKKWQAEEKRKREEERERKAQEERKHREWLTTKEGRRWQKKENVIDLLISIAQPFVWISQIAFVVFSIIFFIPAVEKLESGLSGFIIFLGVVNIIAFLVMFFSNSGCIRVFFLVLSILCSLVLIIFSFVFFEAETIGTGIGMLICSISLLVSNILAFIFPKD